MLLAPLLYSVIAVFLYVTLGFVVSVIISRNDIADVLWGPGIALAVGVAILTADHLPSTVHWLLLSLISLWAVRIAFRIYKKNKHKPEDARYARWRQTWQHFYLRSYLQVFLLQGALMLALASGVLIAFSATSGTLTIPMLLGVVLWFGGFWFEVVGDYQLDRFLKQPEHKGRLMMSGLWRLSRHPNYFGEITMWWGIWLITFSLTGNFLTLISPLTITILIRFVSGVPMLEAHMKNHPDWEKYARATNMLMPGLPRTLS